MRAFTTVCTFSFLRWGYFWPTPTKTIGLPVVYTMLRAVPTFSSTVSNLVMMIPSMILGSESLTAKSIRDWLNFVS